MAQRLWKIAAVFLFSSAVPLAFVGGNAPSETSVRRGPASHLWKGCSMMQFWNPYKDCNQLAEPNDAFSFKAVNGFDRIYTYQYRWEVEGQWGEYYCCKSQDYDGRGKCKTYYTRAAEHGTCVSHDQYCTTLHVLSADPGASSCAAPFTMTQNDTWTYGDKTLDVAGRNSDMTLRFRCLRGNTILGYVTRYDCYNPFYTTTTTTAATTTSTTTTTKSANSTATTTKKASSTTAATFTTPVTTTTTTLTTSTTTPATTEILTAATTLRTATKPRAKSGTTMSKAPSKRSVVILGASIGAVALLVAVIGGAVLYFRRRSDEDELDEDELDSDEYAAFY